VPPSISRLSVVLLTTVALAKLPCPTMVASPSPSSTPSLEDVLSRKTGISQFRATRPRVLRSLPGHGTTKLEIARFT